MSEPIDYGTPRPRRGWLWGAMTILFLFFAFVAVMLLARRITTTAPQTTPPPVTAPAAPATV